MSRLHESADALEIGWWGQLLSDVLDSSHRQQQTQGPDLLGHSGLATRPMGFCVWAPYPSGVPSRLG